MISKFYHIPTGAVEGLGEQNVLFQFTDPVCAIVELLQDDSIASEDNWLWEFNGGMGGVYSELNIGCWCRDAERRSRVYGS